MRRIVILLIVLMMIIMACAEEENSIISSFIESPVLEQKDIDTAILDGEENESSTQKEGYFESLGYAAEGTSMLSNAEVTMTAPLPLEIKKNGKVRVYLGNTYQIEVPDKKIKTCKSGSEKIAKVNKTGLLIPRKAGKTNITIVLTNKKKIKITLKVVDPTVPSKVVISEGKKGTITVGDTLQLTAIVSPATASQEVKWRSSNKAIATVSSTGIVTARKTGSVKIVAKAGKKTAAFTLVVRKRSIEPTPTPEPAQPQMITEIHIDIGQHTFTATLLDNTTAQAFAALLPISLNMTELNGNEKYYYLDGNLDSVPESVGSIKAGDIMLYGDNCIVLFYKSFSTSYRYTRIGHIDDITGLEDAVGNDSVSVGFRS